MEEKTLKRKNHVLVSVLILIVLLGTGSVFAQVKMGYIDSQRILATYSKAVDAQKKLEAETAQASDELKKMENDFRAQQERLEQQAMLLNDEKKQQKAQELQELYMKIQQFSQDKQTELANRQDELLKPVFDKINTVINQIGEKDGYDFIFNGSISGNLVYAKEQYDLTDKVLAELDKE